MKYGTVTIIIDYMYIQFTNYLQISCVSYDTVTIIKYKQFSIYTFLLIFLVNAFCCLSAILGQLLNFTKIAKGFLQIFPKVLSPSTEKIGITL
jgi:hypothetical protein